jgi:hypothetical protein
MIQLSWLGKASIIEWALNRLNVEFGRGFEGVGIFRDTQSKAAAGSRHHAEPPLSMTTVRTPCGLAVVAPNPVGVGMNPREE